MFIDEKPSTHPTESESEVLDRVFAALADPVRRAVLERLKDGALLVSELAAPFDISIQAVPRHIQVLVRAGLVRQERTGRVSRCNLEAGPILEAAVWINGYSHYWQTQFDNLAAWLLDQDQDRAGVGKEAAGSEQVLRASPGPSRKSGRAASKRSKTP